MRKIIILIISILYLCLPCIGQTDKSDKKRNKKYETFEFDTSIIEYQNEYYFIYGTVFVSGMDSNTLCDICNWACRKKGYTKATGINFEQRSRIRPEEIGWPELSQHKIWEGFMIKYQTDWWETYQVIQAEENLCNMIRYKKGSYAAILNAVSEYLGIAPSYYDETGKVIRDFSSIRESVHAFPIDRSALRLANDFEIKIIKSNKQTIKPENPIYFVYGKE